MENGSYNGVIGQLQNGLADFSTKVENMLIDPEVVSLSRVFGTQDWYIGHYINHTTFNKESNFLDYQRLTQYFVPSTFLFIEFISIFIASFLIGLILTSLDQKLKIKNYYLIFFQFSNNLLNKNPSPIAYFFLFNILSVFFIKLFLSCNIKVNI